jgi:amino acid adenylation domain-containing protein
MTGANSDGTVHGANRAVATDTAHAPLDRIDEDVFVCDASLMQDGLWVIDQIDPLQATYNIPVAFELRGRVDWLAFQAAVDDLVARHESLRTSFAARDGAPLQVISPTTKVVIEHRCFADASTSTGVQALVQAEAERPFDLSVAPLLRVQAFSLSEERHLVTFVFHHIIADGWSIAIFFNEFGQVYAARVKGEVPKLPPIAIDYADFSIWQRRRLTSELQAAQLNYWRDTLAGAPNSIELPSDRPRPKHRSHAGSMEWYTVGAETTTLLRDLCRREQTTMFMAVVSVVNVLLARHTGVYDIVIGSPMAGRVRQEIEGTIGFFANTLVLRNTFSPDCSFRDLLCRTRTTTLDAYQHADVPFHQVVGAVRPERAAAAHPLFQVMCTFQSVPGDLLSLPDLEVRPLDVSSGTSKFDLLFEFQERRQVIDASLEYSSELFDVGTVRRWIQRFLILAEAAARQPDVPVSQLSLMPAAERELIRQWSVADAGVTPAAAAWSSIHGAFEQQAERTPEATALIMGPRGMSYDELNQRSNRVARHLSRLGVARGHPVGLCLDRSFDLIVGLLGILKVGGSYVPLDPSYPSQRRRLMAGDAGLKVILTGGTVTTDWVDETARVVHLDSEWPVISREDAAPLPQGIDGADLAYIIYTSGSTGRPKGVAMPHAPLLNLLRWQVARSAAGRDSRTLQFAPVSFDVSFQEVFSTLCSGGSLVLIDDDDRRDSHRLLSVLREQRINRLFLPFVALQALCEAAYSSELMPGDLTEVITAGEQLQITPSVTAFFGSLPRCSLDNQYGPTESHVVTAYRLEGPPKLWPLLPPIGQPIPNARAEVLDERMFPVPIGVPGELYLGGAVLAQGYYRKPELTAERFSFSPLEPDVRLYRTGDAARWRPDGTLEFLGRLDSQLKIRGHRVELREIEAILCTVPGIESAAVSVSGDDAATRRLVGYVVSPSGAVDSETIRRHLRLELPEYMVPATFVELDRLPLTPSGKVERRALPAPKELASATRAVKQPATSTELELAKIWTDLLQVDQVGVDESFFELGGHSLLAMKMFSRIHTVLGRSIPFSTLLQRPTIAELAELLDPQPSAPPKGPSCLVPLRTGGTLPPIFFIHGLGNEVWTFVELTKRLDPQQVVYGIQPFERDSGMVSLADMAEQYVAEIRTVAPKGPYILGGFCSGAVTAFEVARQLRASGQQVALLVVFDYWFDEVDSGIIGFLRNLPLWIAEDLLHTSLIDNIGRIRSKVRQVHNRVLRYLGSKSAVEDVRDQLGMWRYPDHEVRRLRSFFDAMVSYRFEPYDGAIHVFRARTRRLWGRYPSKDMGWGRVATGPLTVEAVPGSHDSMFRAPFVDALAGRLARAISHVFEYGGVQTPPPTPVSTSSTSTTADAVS